jgi:alpha-galactosidase
VVDLAANGGPAIVYWGPDLGPLSLDDAVCLARAHVPQRVSGGPDTPPRLGLAPLEAGGWLHTPGLAARRLAATAPAPAAAGGALAASPLFALAGGEVGEAAARLVLRDEEAGLELAAELEVTPGGIFRQRLTLTNAGGAALAVDHLAATFPLPPGLTELLDTTGHHLRERSPQRHAMTVGSHVRESRRGRPGADNTLVQAAGRPGFGWTSGRVHAVHLAWSGNHRYTAERTPSGEAFIQAGELLTPGEIVLAAGASHSTPWALGAWGEGLNAVARQFHAHVRAIRPHPGHGAGAPVRGGARPARPVTLNTWEAVHFDQSLDGLVALAERAAQVGVERFVLDDGWQRGRRDDTRGLGDWDPDPDVWPDGLEPLAAAVRSLGMEFGLWVEPEMVNPDSDLARAHPEWMLRGRSGPPPPARHQQVLDLANPAAYAHIAGRLHALVSTLGLACLKWDHNRDLMAAYAGSEPRAHAQTEAVYRLLAELAAAHPGIAIESCASGGARIDLGIAQWTDRVWVSDCLDPLERLANQKLTGLVCPPEAMGAHLTQPTVESTGRTVDLDWSAGVALLAHFGVEWDLRGCDQATLERIAWWVALHKRHRELISTGVMVHADTADPALDVRGVVAPDGAEALFSIAQMATSAFHPPPPVCLPGLDSDRRYLVSVPAPEDAGGPPAQSRLAWIERPVALTGRQLAEAGLRPPLQHPERLTLVRLTAARP